MLADVDTRERKTRARAPDLGRSNSPVNWATFSPYAFFTLLAYLNEPISPPSGGRGINYGDYRRPLGYALSSSLPPSLSPSLPLSLSLSFSRLDSAADSARANYRLLV